MSPTPLPPATDGPRQRLTLAALAGQTDGQNARAAPMISHPHECVFVHIPKTAGQSVEAVFQTALGLRGRAGRAALLLRENRDRAQGPRRLAHLYAEEYIRLGHIGAGAFARYFKFAVVRHPYDRAVSEYRYRAAARIARGQQVPGFDAFLAEAGRDEHLDAVRHIVPQVRYTHGADGACLMDAVLRFENLTEEIAPVLTRLLGTAVPLPHRNRSGGAVAMTRDALTPAQRRALADRYAPDFEAFGYDP